jgi:CBS domain-containing protein
VRDLLEQKPAQIHAIAPEETVYCAVALMAKAEVGALLVTHEGRLVGILSERDYARQIILKGRRSQETRVDEIMTRRVFTVSPDASIQDCMRVMTEHQIRHLPVVAGTTIIGVVTIGDVVRATLERQSQTIDELSRYVSGEPRLSVQSP